MINGVQFIRVNAKLARLKPNQSVETANDPAIGSDAVARVWRGCAAAGRG
jgi:hypothetical protein